MSQCVLVQQGTHAVTYKYAHTQHAHADPVRYCCSWLVSLHKVAPGVFIPCCPGHLLSQEAMGNSRDGDTQWLLLLGTKGERVRGHVYGIGTVPLSKCVFSQSVLNKGLESLLCSSIKLTT